MGDVSDIFEEGVVDLKNVELPPQKKIEEVTAPTRNAAYTLVGKSELTWLEKALFDLAYNTLSYLATKYEDDDDLKRDITQTRSDAMELVLQEKFNVKSIHEASDNSLSLKVNDSNDVELLRRRTDG